MPLVLKTESNPGVAYWSMGGSTSLDIHIMTFAETTNPLVYPPTYASPYVLSGSDYNCFMIYPFPFSLPTPSFILPVPSLDLVGVQYSFRIMPSEKLLCNVDTTGVDEMIDINGNLTSSIIFNSSNTILIIACEDRTPVGGPPTFLWNVITSA